jgi:hypothetical protein
MTHWIIRTTMFLVLVVSLFSSARVQAGGVHVDINLGTPPPPVVVVPDPPPVVVAAPPQLVVVPGTTVYYAPSVDHNYFFYGKRYYVYHNDAWFYAHSHQGPWIHVAHQHVPRAVLAVPVEYYRVPPGHGHRHGPPAWAGHGRHGHKHHDKHHHKDD